MNDFIHGLEIGFTSGSIWETILPIVGILGNIILVAVGIHVIHNAWIDYDIVHNGRLERKWHK